MKLSNWSYSRYSTWKECPAKLRYKAEDKTPRESHPAAQRGTDFHKQFELYLVGDSDELLPELEYYRSFLDRLREAGAIPEMPLALDANWKQVPWDSPDRWWRGVYDVVVKAPNETIIIDWKTGQEYKDHRDQREVYAMTYHCVDPTPHVRVIHTYVDKKQNTFTLFHEDELKPIREEWGGRIEEMLNDKDFVPNPGFHCRRCDFSRSKGGPCKF